MRLSVVATSIALIFLTLTLEWVKGKRLQNELENVKIHQFIASGLAVSKLELSHELLRIKKDPTLMAHLTSGRTHSINQSFGGTIRSGYLSALSLYGPRCERLASRSLKGFESSPCEQKGPAESFHTFLSSSDGVPFLSTFERFSLNDKLYLLIADLQLDRSWLLHQKAFAPDIPLKDLEIHFVHPVDGSNPQELAKGLAVTSASPFMFGGLKAISYPFLQLAQLLCFLGLLGLGVRQGRKMWLKERLWGKAVDQFYHAQIHGNAPEKRPSSQADVFEWAQKAFHHLEKQLENDRHAANKKERDLSLSLIKEQNLRKQMERELEKSSFELAKIPLQLGLAGRFAGHWPFVREEFQVITRLMDDFEELVKHVLLQRVAFLQKFSKNWRQGCQTYSARKFLRTLSERPSAGHDSLLEEDLYNLDRITTDCVTVSVNLDVKVRQASLKLQRCYQTLQNLWEMSRENSSSQPASQLEPLVGKVQLLLDTHEGGKQVTLTWLSKDNPMIDHLCVPEFVWQALIYHLSLYYAQSYLSPKEQKWELVLTIKDKSQESYLMFSRRGNLLASPEAEDGRHHLETVKRLTKGLPIRLVDLPSLGALDVKALSWQQCVAKKTGILSELSSETHFSS